MDTVEIVRTVVGIFFILFGLGVYAYDKTHNMVYREYRYSPLSWLGCISMGIIAISVTVERGIFFAIVALVLWSIEKVVLLKIDERKKLKKSS